MTRREVTFSLMEVLRATKKMYHNSEDDVRKMPISPKYVTYAVNSQGKVTIRWDSENDTDFVDP